MWRSLTQALTPRTLIAFAACIWWPNLLSWRLPVVTPPRGPLFGQGCKVSFDYSADLLHWGNRSERQEHWHDAFREAVMAISRHGRRIWVPLCPSSYRENGLPPESNPSMSNCLRRRQTAAEPVRCPLSNGSPPTPAALVRALRRAPWTLEPSSPLEPITSPLGRLTRGELWVTLEVQGKFKFMHKPTPDRPPMLFVVRLPP